MWKLQDFSRNILNQYQLANVDKIELLVALLSNKVIHGTNIVSII